MSYAIDQFTLELQKLLDAGNDVHLHFSADSWLHTKFTKGDFGTWVGMHLRKQNNP